MLWDWRITNGKDEVVHTVSADYYGLAIVTIERWWEEIGEPFTGTVAFDLLSVRTPDGKTARGSFGQPASWND